MKKILFHLLALLMLILIVFGGFSLQAQTYHYVKSKVFINTHGFIYISTGDTVYLEGNIITVRSTVEANRGMISFNGTADWKHNGTAYVDGYVRSRKPEAFIFPVGEGTYRPAAISQAAATAPTDAAYYSTALYDIFAVSPELHSVTNESWIIQGTTDARITLSWTSDISGMVDTVKQLCVAGWDPNDNQWVMIPSAYEPSSSIFDDNPSTLAQGTVITTSEIFPNMYAAYTLGVRNCPNPPTVDSRYETCIVAGNLTLADIPIHYTNIQWYGDVNLTDKMEPEDEIEDSTTYWVTQTVNGCESGASYVTVYINNKMIVPPPALPDTIEVCASLRDEMLLEYLPINSEHLIWYKNIQGTDTVKPTEHLLAISTTYYVGQKIGECASATLKAVFIKYVDEITTAPDLTTPHYFCHGAMIQDLDVKVSGLLTLRWFASDTATTPLQPQHVLEDTTYFAKIATTAHCINDVFTAVKVNIDGDPPKSIEMRICAGKTLGSLPINGYGIKWYADEFLNDPELKVTDVMQAGETYYAANTSGASCAYLAYEVSADPCFTVYGTVFPFLHDTLEHISPCTPDTAFNCLFKVTARLYNPPAFLLGQNPITKIITRKPLFETTVDYYDGSILVLTTPLHPGEIGTFGNPGIPILWEKLGKELSEDANYDRVEEGNNHPDKPVGLYTFMEVPEGEYVLELSARGFVNRYALITIGSDTSLNHRELIPGDLNNDGYINQRDATLENYMRATYEVSHDTYNIMFDLDEDHEIGTHDLELIIDNYLGFIMLLYKDTWDWIMRE